MATLTVRSYLIDGDVIVCNEAGHAIFELVRHRGKEKGGASRKRADDELDVVTTLASALPCGRGDFLRAVTNKPPQLPRNAPKHAPRGLSIGSRSGRLSSNVAAEEAKLISHLGGVVHDLTALSTEYESRDSLSR